MAPAPAAARRGPGQYPRARVVIPLLLLLLGGLAAALAVGLALGSSSASSLGGSASSRPGVTAAAATFRGAARQPSTSAAARPPLAPSSSSSSAAALPSSRHVAPFVAGPASRHLLAYPDADDDERDLHQHGGGGGGGGAGDASTAIAGRVPTRASGEGAGAGAASSSASLVRLTASAAAPARRRLLLEYEPRDDPHGGAADRPGVATRASGEGAADTFDTSVADPHQPTPSASPGTIAAPPPDARLPQPPPARCTFVTYIGGGAGTMELAHDGEERVFVVRERTGSSNISHADDPAASDEESDLEEDEPDCCQGYRDSDFSTAMEKFCKVLRYASHANTVIDKYPWLFRLWEFYNG